MHALIHIGHGLEFGLRGMLVEGTPCDTLHVDEYAQSGLEGLALAAVQDVNIRGSLPPSIFTSSSTRVAENVINRFSSLALDASARTDVPKSKTSGVHAFDIVARVLKDHRFHPREPADFVNQFAEIFAEYLPIVWEHAEKWTVDLNQPNEVERKMEELVWLSSLLYGIGGLISKGFQSDFFLCVAALFDMQMTVNNVN